MAILDILTYPHPNLRIKAQPIINITPEIKQLSQDMLDTMYNANGIGLAATQVNVPQRLLVMDLREDNIQKRYANPDATNHLEAPLVLINPEIKILTTQKFAYEEGCLSVPNVRAVVKRAAKISLSALNLAGTQITIEANDLLSTCIQHEIDHLDGKLFIDYLSKLKLYKIRKQLSLD
jgi:peptide deformylase